MSSVHSTRPNTKRFPEVHGCHRRAWQPLSAIVITLRLVLQHGLEANFASVSVSVVECPDLRDAPWSLAAPGATHVTDVVTHVAEMSCLPLFVHAAVLIHSKFQGSRVSGICGSPRLADVGGVPNLVPAVTRSKVTPRSLQSATVFLSVCVRSTTLNTWPS